MNSYVIHQAILCQNIFSRNDENENKEQAFQCDKKSLLDEYDEDGNYIGDDPALMDSESKTA